MKMRGKRALALFAAILMVATSMPSGLVDGGVSHAENRVVDYSKPVQLPWNSSTTEIKNRQETTRQETAQQEEGQLNEVFLEEEDTGEEDSSDEDAIIDEIIEEEIIEEETPVNEDTAPEETTEKEATEKKEPQTEEPEIEETETEETESKETGTEGSEGKENPDEAEDEAYSEEETEAESEMSDGQTEEEEAAAEPEEELPPAVEYLSGSTALGIVNYSALEGAYLPQGVLPVLEVVTPPDEKAQKAAQDAAALEGRAGRVLAQFRLGENSDIWDLEGNIRVMIGLNEPIQVSDGENLYLVRFSEEGEALPVEANLMIRQNQLMRVTFETDTLGEYALLGVYDAEPETKTCTVTFMGPEGEEVEARTLTAGTPVGALPEAPVREGYTFAGWLDVTEETIVNDNLTVYPSYMEDYPATTADAQTGDMVVHVEVPAGALPADARFRLTWVEPEDYREAVEAALGTGAGQIVAADMSFVGADETEYQPLKPVTLNITLLADMENADSITVVHIDDTGRGEVVAENLSGIEFSFEAESFSVYTLVSNKNSGSTLNVQVVDTDGNSIGEYATKPVTSGNWYSVEELSPAIDGFEFVKATLGAVNGTEIKSLRAVRYEVFFSRRDAWEYSTTANSGGYVTEISQTVYFVYKSTGPTLKLRVTSEGATTVETAIFTVTSTDGVFSKTLTYGELSDGVITLTEADGIELGKTYTVTETGAEVNGYTPTVTYGNQVTLTSSNYSGTLTVHNTYPSLIKVYVYVAGKTPDNKTQFKDNPEFLELLGIDAATVDGYGYFPVGEIYLDSSYLNGKPENAAALINSADDWQKVLSSLGEMNTSTLIAEGGINYAANRGNHVGEYLSQAIGDINKAAGSQCTALIPWHSSSYGFADESVEYHLDLRFQTNKIKFITGNNGFTSGKLKDGTTVDTRAYITGSAIQKPRNLTIPDGYRLVGYYSDANFTTPWNKIGLALTQDEVVYIKITALDNVILYYEPVTPAGGSVSLDAEGLNPRTGKPVGSTATPNAGYTFAGWYSDEACTRQVSASATFIPTKTSGESWVDGTTWYARFEEETVTLIFVAEDHVDHVELVSGDYSAISGDGTKELTLTVNRVTAANIRVRGVAEDDYVIREWTLDGENGSLTTDATIAAEKTDVTGAGAYWTNRTYRVTAETIKRVHVIKQVNTLGTLRASDIDLTVYFALKNKNTGEFVTKDGAVWTESIRIVDGVPEGEAVFDGLQSGAYDVWEVADANASSLTPGDQVMASDSTGKPVFVATISTSHRGTTSNNVMVSDDEPEDSMTVTNTYSHKGEWKDVTGKKYWYTQKNNMQSDRRNLNVPEGAWAELSLVRKDTDEVVRTVTLDGTVDDDGEYRAWEVKFSGVPLVDESGNQITYIIRETGYSNPIGGQYYYQVNEETNEGGAISNAVVYGNINLYKQIEVQPRNSEMDAAVRAALLNMQVRVTGPYGYDQVFAFPTTGEVYNPHLQITDLPAGVYTIEELNYENLIPGRQWDANDSWIYVARNEQKQAATYTGQVTARALVGSAGQSNDSVDVRLRNSYLKYSIQATKVWEDGGKTDADHPSVTFSLYRIDSNGNRSKVGDKTIGANVTGDALTVTWDNMEQQYTYELKENEVQGYTLDSITGNMFSGFVVTNKRSEEVPVRLRKTVSGNMGNANESFTFSIAVYEDEAKTKLLTGEWTASLTIRQADGYVVLGSMPEGAWVTVTEQGAENYITRASTDGIPAIDGSTADSKSFTFQVNALAEGVTSLDVDFGNYANVIIPTGVRLDAAPYGMLLGLALAGLVLMNLRGRKKRRE